MATFSFNEADNYGASNSGSFFQLKNDKDTARVRFLYNSVDDVVGHSVHTIHDDTKDKDIYVNCLRNYNDPIDKCPLCAAGNKLKARVFVQLYNEDTQESQIWERGKKFFDTLSGLSSRYNPLYNEIIEIERNGKKGDMQTTYQPYPVENKPININDIEMPNPIGLSVFEMSADEMRNYLSSHGNASEEAPVRRTNYEDEAPVRRRDNNSRAF